MQIAKRALGKSWWSRVLQFKEQHGPHKEEIRPSEPTETLLSKQNCKIDRGAKQVQNSGSFISKQQEKRKKYSDWPWVRNRKNEAAFVIKRILKDVHGADDWSNQAWQGSLW